MDQTTCDGASVLRKIVYDLRDWRHNSANKGHCEAGDELEQDRPSQAIKLLEEEAEFLEIRIRNADDDYESAIGAMGSGARLDQVRGWLMFLKGKS